MTTSGFITAGPDNALWFADGKHTVGRITAQGAVTITTDPTSPSKVAGLTAGPDGGVWFADFSLDSIGRIAPIDSVTAAPGQGRVGTALEVSGAGFTAGEAVNVTYGTFGHPTTQTPFCLAVAAPDGSFSCTGAVPSDGSRGMHPISAIGASSMTDASSLFLRN